MSSPTSNYLRHNIIRIVELLVFVGIMFTTMQHNIKAQGEMITTLNVQSQATTSILQDVSINIATVQLRLERNEKDIESLKKSRDLFNRYE